MSAGKRIGLAGLAIVTAAGIGLTVAAANGFGFDSAAAAETRPVATEKVTKQNLTASEEKPGKVTNVGEKTLQGTGGVVTGLPAEAAVLERGGQLYRIDEIPTVLLYGALPAYRELSDGTTGADVKQFEENLAALGYTGFDVDTEYTWATAKAVRAWQKDLGVEKTGVVDPARVFYAAGPVRIADVVAKVGDPAGTSLLTVASQNRIVTTDLDESDARFATVGAAVGITLPDTTTVTGTITAVESAIVDGQAGSDGSKAEQKTVLRVSVTPDDPTKLPATGVSTAKIAFTADSREGVLTVPVTALLALSEGGYGVEVAHGKTSKLTAVKTGLFADGRVEVSGDIAEGDSVVTAQ